MQHEIQELKDKLATANAKIVELETKLEERSDCHNGLPAHAWYSKLSAANKKAEKLVEALEYIYQNCDSPQEKWAEETAEQAINEFRGGM